MRFDVVRTLAASFCTLTRRGGRHYDDVPIQLFQRMKLFSSGSSSSSSSLAESNSNQTEAESTESNFASTYHTPVMYQECIRALLSSSSSSSSTDTAKTGPRIFVDGTLGGGGHSEALLRELQTGDLVIGCDVDQQAIDTATQRLRQYTAVDNNDNNSALPSTTTNLPTFQTIHSNFANLHKTLSPELLGNIDGILLDLGVSSHQIDVGERGFSINQDGPLDMRMDATGKTGASLTAAHICNEFDAREIQRLLQVYGDEPRARRIAQAIVEHRPLQTTGDLVTAVSSVVPAFAKKGRRMGRSATMARVFQSLRITVNQELQMLEQALLEMAPTVLKPGGRLVVLSYHSLEDRITKRVMRDGTLEKVRHVEKDLYGNSIGPPKPFRTMGKKLKATEEEVERNARARSATLRVAERL